MPTAASIGLPGATPESPAEIRFSHDDPSPEVAGRACPLEGTMAA